jgi:hypothetical protein
VTESTITATGPLFTGGAARVGRDIAQEAAWLIGTKANSEVHLLLDRSIKHPTPYYETQVTQQRRGDDVVVHDRGVIYGPWLEGTSSRNQSTRFKGYASFRRATQAVDKQAVGWIADVAQRYVSRMQ